MQTEQCSRIGRSSLCKMAAILLEFKWVCNPLKGAIQNWGGKNSTTPIYRLRVVVQLSSIHFSVPELQYHTQPVDFLIMYNPFKILYNPYMLEKSLKAGFRQLHADEPRLHASASGRTSLLVISVSPADSCGDWWLHAAWFHLYVAARASEPSRTISVPLPVFWFRSGAEKLECRSCCIAENSGN